jgi:hypothetical protein
MEIRNRLVPDAFGDPARLIGQSRVLCDTVTITTVYDGEDTFIADVTASADGDVTATIPHTMGVAPGEVYLLPALEQALTALSCWVCPVASIGVTNVVCTKLTSTGSGSATKQLRVIAKRPHSLGR